MIAEQDVRGRWVKSSYSGTGGGDCVEVAPASRVCVHVRDSKRPALATLAFPAAQWAALTSPLRRHA